MIQGAIYLAEGLVDFISKTSGDALDIPVNVKSHPMKIVSWAFIHAGDVERNDDNASLAMLLREVANATGYMAMGDTEEALKRASIVRFMATDFYGQAQIDTA